MLTAIQRHSPFFSFGVFEVPELESSSTIHELTLLNSIYPLEEKTPA
jgi:hypothetical protein